MIKQILYSTLSGLAFILQSCSGSDRNQSSDPPPVQVNIVRVDPSHISYFDTYPCTVTALKEVGLRGEVTGYVTGIYFTEGAVVHKGDRLYEIDRRQYEAVYKEASDNLKIAEENLAKIQLDVDRYNTLNSQQAIARQRYDYALTDLANAKLQVSVATEEQVKAKTNLEYSLITAPFDGTIGISLVKLGDLVTPGQTLLNTISSDDPMGVDFVIGQAELGRFRQLQNMNPSPSDSTLSLVLPDQTIYTATGRIGLIDRAVDPQTGTIKVRLIFSNQKNNLRPGMDCDVRVTHEPEGKQILVPFKAVVEQMGEYFVFLSVNKKARETRVVLGPRVGASVIIRQGIKQGDEIVVDGIEKLTDGSTINPDSSMASENKSTKNRSL